MYLAVKETPWQRGHVGLSAIYVTMELNALPGLRIPGYANMPSIFNPVVETVLSGIFFRAQPVRSMNWLRAVDYKMIRCFSSFVQLSAIRVGVEHRVEHNFLRERGDA